MHAYYVCNTRQTVETDRPRSLQERAFDFVTHNGQRFVRDGQEGQDGGADYAIITHDGWAYPSGSIHGKNTIVSIDWASRKGVIRRNRRLRGLVAEDARFELARLLHQHAFQACAIGH